MSLDYGARRLGVAFATPPALFPQPYGILEQGPDLMENIKALATEHGVKEIVIGLPRGLDGQETHQTKEVRNFAQQLSVIPGFQLHLQDEALTSRQAEEEYASRGVRYNKGDVDALAATYILEDFLREQHDNRL